MHEKTWLYGGMTWQSGKTDSLLLAGRVDQVRSRLRKTTSSKDLTKFWLHQTKQQELRQDFLDKSNYPMGFEVSAF